MPIATGLYTRNRSSRYMTNSVPGERSSPLIFVKTEVSSDPPGMKSLQSGVPDIQRALQAVGVDGVEIAVRGVSEDIGRNEEMLEELQKKAEPWIDEEMIVHPHPYTTGGADPAAFTPTRKETVRQAFEQVVTTANALKQTSDTPLALTYHPGSVTGEEQPDREELVERSSEFFAMADEVLADFEDELRVVAETQLPASRDSATTRIGDVPEESIVMAENRQHVGVCWDTGHYILSSERLDSPTFPPSSLIQSVEHMHLHDVREGTDHQPPEPGDDRLSEAINAAATMGHLRSITLEYDYAKAVDDQEDVDGMLRYLEEVISWIQEVSTSASTASIPDSN